MQLDIARLDNDTLNSHLSTHKGKTLVIKYGGNAMTEPAHQESFTQDIARLHSMGIRLVIVHGGGPQVDDMLDKIGHQSCRIDGMRITDPTTMQITEMVLGASVNGLLVNLINQHSTTPAAVGINGKDGRLLVADKLKSAVDLGLVGQIHTVNTALIDTLLAQGFLPVVAPIATCANSRQTYNINADTAASELAKALQADALIVLSNIDGVLDKQKTLLTTLNLSQVQALIADGTIYGGMLPKIQAAAAAIGAGVKSVSIINGEQPHSLLSLLGCQHPTIGTTLLA